jgi:hypothetical protein
MPVKQFINDDDIKEITDDSEFIEEDEDDVSPTNHAIQSGWEAAIRAMEGPKRSARTYVKDFRFEEEPQLIKFLDDTPVATFFQYWVGYRSGRKSFISPVFPDYSNRDEVSDPLMEYLQKLKDTDPRAVSAVGWPSKKVVFSVVNFSLGEPVQQALIVTVTTVGTQLRRLNEDPKTGPLDKHFWSMSRTGSGPQTAYSILPVKARDLQEDWYIDPQEAEAAAARMTPQGSDAFQPASFEELQEIARELAEHNARR